MYFVTLLLPLVAIMSASLNGTAWENLAVTKLLINLKCLLHLGNL